MQVIEGLARLARNPRTASGLKRPEPTCRCPWMARHGAQSLLRRAVELGASDIHLKVGLPPILRRDGALSPLEEYAILTDRDVEVVLEVVGTRSPERLEAFKQIGRPRTSPTRTSDLPRFRVNAFRQRGHISFAFRVIPKDVPTFEMLGLPPGVQSAWRTSTAGSCS